MLRPAMTIAVDLGHKATKQTKMLNVNNHWHLNIYYHDKYNICELKARQVFNF